MIGILFFNALMILGAHVVTRDGYALGFVGRALAGHAWAMPLTECPVCMSSVWGAATYLILFPVGLSVIPYVLALAGCSALISGAYYTAEALYDEATSEPYDTGDK